ncbi:Spo0E family sporulation regulatory protein-aspartic acid phosphatase [Mesobacillus maritimus]|uniref:Spo0E family sporulation regulatory protein-aspartic acid phosphatase n=1 Tax=Mesobacillus maritimus TaxID=1643336 RepID=UPI00384FA9D0
METTLPSVLNPNELLSYIEFLRKDLINKGLNFGFNDERTIQASQELDYFIFEFQRITSYSH